MPRGKRFKGKLNKSIDRRGEAFDKRLTKLLERLNKVEDINIPPPVVNKPRFDTEIVPPISRTEPVVPPRTFQIINGTYPPPRGRLGRKQPLTQLDGILGKHGSNLPRRGVDDGLIPQNNPDIRSLSGIDLSKYNDIIQQRYKDARLRGIDGGLIPQHTISLRSLSGPALAELIDTLGLTPEDLGWVAREKTTAPPASPPKYNPPRKQDKPPKKPPKKPYIPPVSPPSYQPFDQYSNNNNDAYGSILNWRIATG